MIYKHRPLSDILLFIYLGGRDDCASVNTGICSKLRWTMSCVKDAQPRRRRPCQWRSTLCSRLAEKKKSTQHKQSPPRSEEPIKAGCVCAEPRPAGDTWNFCALDFCSPLRIEMRGFTLNNVCQFGLLTYLVFFSFVSLTAAVSFDLTELRNKVAKIKLNPRGNLWATGKNHLLNSHEPVGPV